MISIITCTNRSDKMMRIFENYESQTLKNKELIIILNNDSMDISTWRAQAEQYGGVSVFQMPERKTVSECKNFAVAKTSYDYIAKFDDDDYYSPTYLESTWSAFTQYKRADIVGKSSVYYYFQISNCLGLFPSSCENTFTEQVVDSTLAFKKTIFNTVQFTKMKMGSDKKFQRDCRAKGFHIYSTDRYNHAVIRSGKPNLHTWKISDEHLKKKCINHVYTEDYESLVNAQEDRLF
ncbi:glycosyltransferase [Bacillus sp. JCM 19041]|uniref:glycosyltransferase family 2 protein n=1 Tax=Bacillus sp. JCM 19041 TaxID=1460637 RepID=UPI0006D2C9C1